MAISCKSRGVSGSFMVMRGVTGSGRWLWILADIATTPIRLHPMCFANLSTPRWLYTWGGEECVGVNRGGEAGSAVNTLGGE